MSKSSTVTAREKPVEHAATATSGAVTVHSETFVIDTDQRVELIDLTNRIMEFVQRFNVREAICQMLDLTAFPFPANLSLARVRRQKNHSGKLQSADGQLEHDGSIKEPENPRG